MEERALSAGPGTSDVADADKWAFVNPAGLSYSVFIKVRMVMMVAFEKKEKLGRQTFVYPIADGKRGVRSYIISKRSGEVQSSALCSPNAMSMASHLVARVAISHRPVKSSAL